MPVRIFICRSGAVISLSCRTGASNVSVRILICCSGAIIRRLRRAGACHMAVWVFVGCSGLSIVARTGLTLSRYMPIAVLIDGRLVATAVGCRRRRTGYMAVAVFLCLYRSVALCHGNAGDYCHAE